MLTGKYQLKCRFNAAARLPFFKGSALRGSFGHALKKVSCALRRQTCEDCLLSQTCAYYHIFATRPCAEECRHPQLVSCPHPYVLEPPSFGQQNFESGNVFIFNLLLFGKKANSLLPYIIFAVTEMGKSGIGQGLKSGNGSFELISASHSGDKVYSNGELAVDTKRIEDITLEKTGSLAQTAIDMITVHFKTPLRVKHQGHLLTEIDFRNLVKAALRRYSSLEECYGKGYPNIDYRGMLERAALIDTDIANTSWRDHKRYSNRQQSMMTFGGITGTASYHGDIKEFLPLLRFCENVHIGKQTSFGFGKIGLDMEDE